MKKLVVDLTKAWPGTEQVLVASALGAVRDAGELLLLRKAGGPGVEPGGVHVPAGIPMTEKALPGPDGAYINQVSNELRVLLGEPGVSEVVAVSHYGPLIGFGRTLREQGETRLDVRHFKQLKPAPEPASQPGAEQGPAGVAANERSLAFRDSLERRRLGPFARARPFVLDAMEEIARASPGIGACELIEQAIDAAKKKYAGSPEASIGRRQPWRNVEDAIKTLAMSEPVFIGPEGEFSLSPETLDAPVSELRPDWREALEGRLIVALVEDGLDVGVTDTRDLAGALFNSRTKYNGRIRQLFTYLVAKKGVLQVSPDARRVLMLPPKAGSLSIAS